MDDKKVIIVYKESMISSMLSDFFTFAVLAACIVLSIGSIWWTVVSSVIFLFFLLTSIVSANDKTLKFYSVDELQNWVDEQKNKK